MNSKKAVRQLRELKKLGNSVRLAADGWKSGWQTLIAIMMSARTRDEVTIKTAEELYKRFKNVKSLAEADFDTVSSMIRPVNFYLNKTKTVIGCAKVLAEKYDGEPPLSINELIELPGVGRKTANVFLASFGKSAIGVDTHVAYVSRYLGWTKNINPQKIEKDLESLFPKQYWAGLNDTCVHFGKNHVSRRKKNDILDSIKKI